MALRYQTDSAVEKIIRTDSVQFPRSEMTGTQILNSMLYWCGFYKITRS